MRTTLVLNDHLFKLAKERALKSGVPLRQLMEEALRAFLSPRGSESHRQRPIKLKTFKGKGLAPGVDLDDSAGLLDLMEKRD